MGYTHYWRNVPGVLTNEVLDDIQRIIENSPVPLANGMGQDGTGPEYTTAGVRLNGVEDDSYETFALIPRVSFDFCKTAQRPYDVVVTAILLRMYEEGVVVSSDGDREDWESGYQLFRQALGRSASENVLT